jgi:hypothetical protein
MLEAKELEECTFKPKILTTYDSNKSKGSAIDKCMELFMKAKPLKEKRDKTKDDFDFEKAKDECTFQPNIESSQKTLEVLFYGSQQRMMDSQFFASGDSDITQHIKGYQMVTQRLKKGRDDREKVKAMTTRGAPGTQPDEA